MMLLSEILKKKYADQNRSNKVEIDAIKREIDRLDQRSKNARALMLDGDITAEDYRIMKKEIDETLQRLNVEHHKSQSEILDLDKKLDQMIRALTNLENLYEQGDVELKRRLIGSIFPNKLVYKKKSVRTVDMNPAVELIFSNIKGSRRRKKEKHTDFGVLSHRVESEGFEPSSKRRIFKLSTCLFPDWFSTLARTGTPKTKAYILVSYKSLVHSLLPAQKFELPKTIPNGQRRGGSTCPTYYTSEGLSQFTFSKLSSKCV